MSLLSSVSVSRMDSNVGGSGEPGELGAELGRLSDVGSAGEGARHAGELGMLALIMFIGMAGESGAIVLLLSSDSSDATDCEFCRDRPGGLHELHGRHKLVSSKTSPLAPLNIIPQQTSVFFQYVRSRKELNCTGVESLRLLRGFCGSGTTSSSVSLLLR